MKSKLCPVCSSTLYCVKHDLSEQYICPGCNYRLAKDIHMHIFSDAKFPLSGKSITNDKNIILLKDGE